MTKQEFINRLRWFAANEGRGLPDEYGHPDYWPQRGEAVLAGMIADYLEHPWIEDCEDWFRNLPNLLVTAFEVFRTEPEFHAGRLVYASEVDSRKIPNLVDVYAGGIHRVLVAHGIARLVAVLSGELWLKEACRERFEAQMDAIRAAWRRFVRVAYAKTLARIKTESHRGNVGTFGATKLLTFDCAGRVMFTFQSNEGQMTFVADGGDPTGERSGSNSPGAPWQACVDMINEVTNNWDIDKLKPSDTVGIG